MNPASLTTDAAYTRPRCGGEKILDFLGRGNDEGGGNDLDSSLRSE